MVRVLPIVKGHYPSFAEVVCTAERDSATKKVKAVRLSRLLGKKQPIANVTLDQKSGAQGSASFPFCALEGDENIQEEKRKAVVANCRMLWAWRSQLEKIKLEVDRAPLRVIEGLKGFGPISRVHTKPNRALKSLLPKPTKTCKKVF